MEKIICVSLKSTEATNLFALCFVLTTRFRFFLFSFTVKAIFTDSDPFIPV
jgi:hypothetical protein